MVVSHRVGKSAFTGRVATRCATGPGRNVRCDPCQEKGHAVKRAPLVVGDMYRESDVVVVQFRQVKVNGALRVDFDSGTEFVLIRLV